MRAACERFLLTESRHDTPRHREPYRYSTTVKCDRLRDLSVVSPFALRSRPTHLCRCASWRSRGTQVGRCTLRRRAGPRRLSVRATERTFRVATRHTPNVTSTWAGSRPPEATAATPQIRGSSAQARAAVAGPGHADELVGVQRLVALIRKTFRWLGSNSPGYHAGERIADSVWQRPGRDFPSARFLRV